MCLKEITLRSKVVNRSRLNSQHNWGAIWSFNEKENLHIDNDEDIHMTSENSEESGYGHSLDLLIIFDLIACSVSYK